MKKISSKVIRFANWVSGGTVWAMGNTSKMMYIPKDARVLDVGSGHQPNIRANVCLDKYIETTIHRNGEIVVPQWAELVEGDALKMPFKNKEFDFVIASHIAEHVDDPIQFCRELSRVGKSGYIETPGVLTEYFNPHPYHKWIVKRYGGILLFKKKDFSVSKFPRIEKFFYSGSFLSWFFVKLWRYVPGAYVKFHWKDFVIGVVI